MREEVPAPVRLSKNTSPSAQAAVVDAARRRHATALRSYATELLRGDRPRAHAIVGDTWAALEKISEPEADERLAVWLFADVRRRATAAQRASGLAPSFDEREEREGDEETPERVFARLTPKQQEVLQLKFGPGFRHEDIARIVDLSPPHAAQLLHNALRRLARAFRPGEHGGDAERSGDYRLTLAALGELDGEAWRAWEAAQLNPAAANERLDEIRRTAQWTSRYLARGGNRGAHRRARGNRRSWLVGGIAAAAVATLAWFWFGSAADERAGTATEAAKSTPGAVALAVPPRAAAPDAVQPSGADVRTLGVFRERPPVEGARLAAAESPAAGGASESALEPAARPEGIAGARAAEEPAADREGAESRAFRSEPRATGEAARLETDARGHSSDSGTAAIPPVAPVRPLATTVAAPVASTDTAAIVALKRALGEGRWPKPGQVDAAGLRRHFAAATRRASRAPGFAPEFEAAEAPWAPEVTLVRVSVQAPAAPAVVRAPANVILLLDVSGSMDAPNRLPLVQEAVRGLLDRLQPDDRVGVVTYAGESRVLLAPTPLAEVRRVREAVQALEARGRTNGGAGLAEAFALARSDGREHGEHLVILCTDGEFNMGQTGEGELAQLVAANAAAGVRLAIFGFGRHGQIDPRLENLAVLGRGGSGYLNTRADAVAVMLGQFDDLLAATAEDVRLALAIADEPPGEVTAEKLLPGDELGTLLAVQGGDDVRAQLSYRRPGEAEARREAWRWAGERSAFAATSPEFRFAAAVARCAELLGGTPDAAAAEWDQLAAWAGEAVDDAGGYRAEFLALVAQARAARMRD